jgi:hypothetical protein
MHIAGHRSTISDMGQPAECYICKAITTLTTTDHTSISSNPTPSPDVGKTGQVGSKQESGRCVERNKANAARG